MKITVLAKINSKSEKVEKIGEGEYKVFVNKPAKMGQANKRIIELLSKHLEIPKSLIYFEHGIRSKKKIFEIKQ